MDRPSCLRASRKRRNSIPCLKRGKTKRKHPGRRRRRKLPPRPQRPPRPERISRPRRRKAAALQAARTALAEKEDQYLRLAAEYDNYRKRTAKEKESAWTQAKADTVAAFLPVYDNLERALKQETGDEAYAKGVEMTMNGLQDVLTKLGVEVIPALGETFDPNLSQRGDARGG